MKTLENLLKTFLSEEQIAALTEEISLGIKKINSMVDRNKKAKATKKMTMEILHRIDNLIEKSNKMPPLLSGLYSLAKKHIKDAVQPILEKMAEEEDYSNLDDIPNAAQQEEQQNRGNAKNINENNKLYQNNHFNKKNYNYNRSYYRNRSNLNLNKAEQKPHSLQKSEVQPEPQPEAKQAESPKSVSAENAPTLKQPLNKRKPTARTPSKKQGTSKTKE